MNSKKRISGQALVEHVVLWPVLILITMAAIQLGLLYRGHATLEHATFMAAREGSINNAFKAPMKKMLASAMAPLDMKANPNIANHALRAGASSVPGTTYAANFGVPTTAGGADVEIVSPSRAMFNHFAKEQYVLEPCTGRSCPGGGSMREARARVKQIPNDNLSARPATTTRVGTGSNASSVNLQDANLLKIRAHWCFPLQVPVINIAINQALNLLGSSAETRSCQAKTVAHNATFGYPIYYIPLSAGSIVRMQSPVRCEDRACSNLGAGGVAASAGNNGTGSNTGGNSGNGGNTGGSTGNGGNNSGGNHTGGNNGSGTNLPGNGEPNEPPLCTAQQSTPTHSTGQDQGVLGQVWDSLSAMAGEARDFIRGFWDGLKDQLGDFVDMITDPVETAKGLYELAMAFIEDPAGTAQALGDALGKDLNQLMHCGSYDRGRVLGNYISPAAMLKIAGKLAKFGRAGGGLRAALDEAKKELGCASFAAGTPVVIPGGFIAIEQLREGTAVASRTTYKLFSDQPRPVTATFRRIAPSYHRITTEYDRFDVTPEHPFWVQGQGWVPIKDIPVGTPVAKADGDTMIMSNEVIDEPLEVFNISVENTPNYFVGTERVWVHNASCDIGGGGGTGAQFADNAKLMDHYNRHGSDFGAKTPAEYVQQADVFLTGQMSPGTLQKTRANGDVVRFNPATDEFGVISSSGVIRTYYKPDPKIHGYPTNLDYFNAQ